MSKSYRSLAAPGVQQLKSYQPGKPVDELERELGITDSIKLASNENPLGPCEKALAAIAEHSHTLHYYPDGSGFKLCHRIADRHEVTPDCITLGNGSNDILELVARAFLTAGNSAVYSEYCFAIYPLVVQAVGAKACVAAANRADHTMPMGHNLGAILDAVTDDTRVLFIANPNNPTGTWLEPQELRHFIQAVPDQVIVVLDLAYHEYMAPQYQIDVKQWLDAFPNLVITCTFSKIYALAGLRIGYAVSSPEIADILNRVRQPFNTSSLAQAAALASLDDKEHVNRSVDMNNAGRDYLQQALGKMQLTALPTMTNFITIDLGREAMPVYDALLHKGVIVRSVASYGMPEHIRVTIGTEQQNRRFIAALSEII